MITHGMRWYDFIEAVMDMERRMMEMEKQLQNFMWESQQPQPVPENIMDDAIWEQMLREAAIMDDAIWEQMLREAAIGYRHAPGSETEKAFQYLLSVAKL